MQEPELSDPRVWAKLCQKHKAEQDVLFNRSIFNMAGRAKCPTAVLGEITHSMERDMAMMSQTALAETIVVWVDIRLDHITLWGVELTVKLSLTTWCNGGLTILVSQIGVLNLSTDLP